MAIFVFFHIDQLNRRLDLVYFALRPLTIEDGVRTGEPLPGAAALSGPVRKLYVGHLRLSDCASSSDAYKRCPGRLHTASSFSITIALPSVAYPPVNNPLLIPFASSDA